MHTASFIIPGLSPAGEIDLANALVGVSGVAEIELDRTAGTLTIRYDPDFTNDTALADAIKRAGYRTGAVEVETLQTMEGHPV